MKELLRKEMTLTALPLTYFFLAFSAMTMIPGYPILVGGFFMCMGIFYTFQSARECNDILYTALLPVKKSDVVKAKYAFVIGVEAAGFLLCAVMTLIRMTVLGNAAVYKANVMMNANLVFLGFLLIVFMVFNCIFLAGFFRSAYYIGKPFLFFCIVSFMAIAVGESLHHIPGLESLNSQTEELGAQGIVFATGLLLYLLGTAISYRKSVASFERIDL